MKCSTDENSCYRRTKRQNQGQIERVTYIFGIVDYEKTKIAEAWRHGALKAVCLKALCWGDKRKFSEYPPENDKRLICDAIYNL